MTAGNVDGCICEYESIFGAALIIRHSVRRYDTNCNISHNYRNSVGLTLEHTPTNSKSVDSAFLLRVSPTTWRLQLPLHTVTSLSANTVPNPSGFIGDHASSSHGLHMAFSVTNNENIRLIRRCVNCRLVDETAATDGDMTMTIARPDHLLVLIIRSMHMWRSGWTSAVDAASCCRF